ncbi:MAG: dihydroneopterin aldolase [Thermomonas hydrothermalis]|uniref:dihydroneopterin aldolase n=1 Tax=Thermomonas hydrothermalis TaxID=213588 RepID=UPI0023534B34|nr:dihydroneopterin aldolase [Thermomonas hydrothermalis]MCL6618787.1 dihydroneopterin aldolase [Thermomonas hydrothermalis]
MTDVVFIDGLCLDAVIGVHAHERLAPQPLRLDIRMQFDTRRAAASDALSDALDYDAVARRLAEYVASTRFALVETLAERCAALILDEFGAERVQLRLAKPTALKSAAAVGVEIARARRSS